GSTVRLEPAGPREFTVSLGPSTFDPSLGPELTFGVPGARFPGDDDSQEIAFPAGFPFFGTTYASVWVNTDGNITLGEPDFASSDGDKARHVLGPPRLSALLHDWNPQNALNPAGSGSIHAVVKTDPDRLVATWDGVADFEGGISSTFQLTLHSSGAVEITFEEKDPASTKYGATGIPQGGGAAPVRALRLPGLT